MAKLETRVLRYKRHRRIRARMSGTEKRPRLSVFRSSNHIYAQVIDDNHGNTVAAASSLTPGIKEKAGELDKTKAAELVGAAVGKIAAEKGITEVVFDRGGYKYQGRVKSLAEAARKAGLRF